MNKILLSLSIILILLLTGCSNKKVKYVFLFIGDGMGMSQIYATQIYLKADDDPTNDLIIPNFPVNSSMTTYSTNSLVTCSSAAATAMSTGFKTDNGVLCKSPDFLTDYETFSVKAKRNGFKVGILSSVAIDHATPAGFYAHNKSRNNYYEISMELPNYNIDYFGCGGFHYPTGKENNKPSAYLNAQNKGYKLVNTKKGFENLSKTDSNVFAINPDIYTEGEMFWEIDRKPASLSLADFTKKGIELLDNKNGFFMMIEGGKIDWAGHDNDAGTLIHEVIAFNNAIKVAFEFYKQHADETLIIVTADHETGSMFNGINYSIQPELIKHQAISEQEFAWVIDNLKKNESNISFQDILALVEQYFGLGNKEKGLEIAEDEKEFLKKAYNYEILSDNWVNPEEDYLENDDDYSIAEAAVLLLNKKAGFGWGTHDHSGTPVPVFAIGGGQDKFMKQFDNTELPVKISEIMQFKK